MEKGRLLQILEWVAIGGALTKCGGLKTDGILWYSFHQEWGSVVFHLESEGPLQLLWPIEPGRSLYSCFQAQVLKTRSFHFLSLGHLLLEHRHLLGASLTTPSGGPPGKLLPLLTALTKLTQTIISTDLLAILEVDSPTLGMLLWLMPCGTEMSCPQS